MASGLFITNTWDIRRQDCIFHRLGNDTFNMSLNWQIVDDKGSRYSARLENHSLFVERILVTDDSGNQVAEMLFGPLVTYETDAAVGKPDHATLRLKDISVDSRFRGFGIGRHLIAILKTLAEERGFSRITGICKSYDYPAEKKQGLAEWYISQGFTVTPRHSDEPGFVGDIIHPILHEGQPSPNNLTPP